MDAVASLARAALIALAALLPPVAPTLAAAVCPSTPPAAPVVLPHLRSAVTNGVEAVIVALGSSTTQGVMASDLAHSYPAVLQQVLSVGLPEAHVAVINRGIGGQDAMEGLARLEADVLRSGR